MDKEKEMQELYMQLQVIEQYMKNMQKQLEMIEAQFSELMLTSQAIGEFKKLKEGTEILVPLSNGIFAKAELKDNRNLLLNIGSDVVVRKNPESAKQLIEKQIVDINEVRETISKEMEKLIAQADLYNARLQKLANQ